MNIRNLCLLLVALGISLSSAQAQEMSWRKHRKLALQLEKEGDFFAAAENFRMAWEKKQSKETVELFRSPPALFRRGGLLQIWNFRDMNGS